MERVPTICEATVEDIISTITQGVKSCATVVPKIFVRYFEEYQRDVHLRKVWLLRWSFDFLGSEEDWGESAQCLAHHQVDEFWALHYAGWLKVLQKSVVFLYHDEATRYPESWRAALGPQEACGCVPRGVVGGTWMDADEEPDAELAGDLGDRLWQLVHCLPPQIDWPVPEARAVDLRF